MKAVFALLVILASFALRAETLTITYPPPASDKDIRYAYIIDLLGLALDKTGGDFRLLPAQIPMTQSRIIRELKNGIIDIAWLNTTREREAELLPVRIPIYRGYIGWRLFLIRPETQARFDQVHALKDLANFVVALGHDWPDVTIMGQAGLPVQKNPVYDGIFKQLAQGRVDYLSRSVLEIGLEVKAHADQGLVIEKGLMLHYPGAFYFFFSPERQKLADRIRTGLLLATEDGSFERLFQRHWGKIIQDAQIEKRRIIRIENPLFPETPPEIPLRAP